MVGCRKGLALKPHTRIKDGFEHRLAGADVGCVIKGGIHCFSLYLKDIEGMGETNLAILTEVAALIGTVRGPWIVGGDWNLTPDTLQASNWPATVGGVVRAPSDGTCNEKTYDYVVTSANLSSAVVHTTRVDDGGLVPHPPARIFLAGDARHKGVRRLIRPTAVPGTLPHGPNPKARELTEQEAKTHEGLRLEREV